MRPVNMLAATVCDLVPCLHFIAENTTGIQNETVCRRLLTRERLLAVTERKAGKLVLEIAFSMQKL